MTTDCCGEDICVEDRNAMALPLKGRLILKSPEAHRLVTNLATRRDSHHASLLALGASVAFLVGCGTVASQPALSPTGTLAHQSRALAPNANCPSNPSGSGILVDGDFSQALVPPQGG